MQGGAPEGTSSALLLSAFHFGGWLNWVRTGLHYPAGGVPSPSAPAYPPSPRGYPASARSRPTPDFITASTSTSVQTDVLRHTSARSLCPDLSKAVRVPEAVVSTEAQTIQQGVLLFHFKTVVGCSFPMQFYCRTARSERFQSKAAILINFARTTVHKFT